MSTPPDQRSSAPDLASPSAILATAVIPWTVHDEFDAPRFRHQVQIIARQLTRHIYLFGTAGEGYAVSDAQFSRIAATFIDCAREHDVSPMLGVISLSLRATIDRIAQGRAMGFNQFQLSLPSWGALNDRELEVFFAATCGRFPDCQFHLYNVPRTKRLLTARELSRLAATHPNFVALKSGARDPAVIADLLTLVPRLRCYFTETAYVQARRTHEVGLLISLASINARRARAFVAGSDADRARDLPELQAIGVTLREIAGDRFHMDGAFDKMLFRLSDPAFPLRLLPPYESATEADFDRFRAALPPGWSSPRP